MCRGGITNATCPKQFRSPGIDCHPPRQVSFSTIRPTISKNLRAGGSKGLIPYSPMADLFDAITLDEGSRPALVVHERVGRNRYRSLPLQFVKDMT